MIKMEKIKKHTRKNKALSGRAIAAACLAVFLCLYCNAALANDNGPAAVSIFPAAPFSIVDKPVTFTTVFTHPQGVEKINYVMLRINDIHSGVMGLCAVYNRHVNRLYMRNYSGSTPVAESSWFEPGSNNVLENAYVKIDCSKTTVSVNGENLTINWNITFKQSFSGVKKIYLYARDDSGASNRWKEMGVWTAALKNSAPDVLSISPTLGVSVADEEVVFNTAYTDPNGWGDINATLFIETPSKLQNYLCEILYDPDSNKIFIRETKNAPWPDLEKGVVPGTRSPDGKDLILENEFIKVNCTKTVIKPGANGMDLSIDWCVSFKESTVTEKETKRIYPQVLDNSGLSYVYRVVVPAASWIVLAKELPIIVTSSSPQYGSTFLAGAKIDFIMNAASPDNSQLEYQFADSNNNNTVMQSWSPVNIHSVQTDLSQKSVGRRCDVRDKNNKTNRLALIIHCSLVNPPAEQILNRVAENYAKITDMESDMVLSATLGGAPLGEDSYCRYYFKAPDKERIDTFTGDSRLDRAQAMVIQGANLYLFDERSNRKVRQNTGLLPAGVILEQFNALDINYNPAKFLEAHKITVNPPAGPTIASLDAVPNTPNKLYDKLHLLVEYNKGVIMEFSIYKKDLSGKLQLVQKTETDTVLQMPNGAYLPVKITKYCRTDSGAPAATLLYDNPRINGGLTDNWFKEKYVE